MKSHADNYKYKDEDWNKYVYKIQDRENESEKDYLCALDDKGNVVYKMEIEHYWHETFAVSSRYETNGSEKTSEDLIKDIVQSRGRTKNLQNAEITIELSPYILGINNQKVFFAMNDNPMCKLEVKTTLGAIEKNNFNNKQIFQNYKLIIPTYVDAKKENNDLKFQFDAFNNTGTTVRYRGFQFEGKYYIKTPDTPVVNRYIEHNESDDAPMINRKPIIAFRNISRKEPYTEQEIDMLSCSLYRMIENSFEEDGIEHINLDHQVPNRYQNLPFIELLYQNGLIDNND